MPNIDYTSMNQQMSALGAKRGAAMGELDKQRKKYERKVRMEQRMAQLAKDKAMQDNELAKTKYTQVKAAQAAESQDWSTKYSEGHIEEDGTYTKKYWMDKALNEYVNSGVKRSSEDMEHFYAEAAKEDGGFYLKKVQSGASRGMTRQYASTDAEVNLKRQLDYNQQVLQRDSQKEFLEGLEASGARLGQNVGDSLFGKEEGLQEPEIQRTEVPQGHGRFDEVDLGTPEFTKAEEDGLDPKSVIQVYGFNADGSIDTSTQHTLFTNKSDGKLYTATGEGAVPWDGNYVDVESYGSTKSDGLGISDYKNDINPETRERFTSANKSIRLAEGIAELSTVDTTAMVSTLPARVTNFLGTEYEALKDNEDSKHAFVSDKINAIVRTDSGATPDTLDEISAALGQMDSQKLALAYAVVKMNRGKGKFSAQELMTQLELYKDKGLPYMLSSINTTYKEAVKRVKSDVKSMAAEATVLHMFKSGNKQSKSQILSSLDTEPRQDTNGDWVIRIRPEDQGTYGARYIVVSSDGGVHYNQ